MKTDRLAAFSDGVLAIIITIMVLEMKTPHGADLDALHPLIPVFIAYILSLSTSASIGTITTICCMRHKRWAARCCGRTSICYFGFL